MEKATTDITRKEQRQVLLRLLTYTKPHIRLIVLAFALLLLTIVGDVLGPIIVKVFIDDYLTPRNLQFEPLFMLGAAYMTIQILNVVFSYLQMYFFQKIAVKIIHHMRVDVFAKIHSLGLRFFDKTPAGSIVSRITNDTEVIKDMFISVLVTFIQSGLMMLGIFVAMFSLNWRLGLFCLFILPVVALIIHLYRKYSSRVYQELREQLGRLNAKLSETLQGMGIIQMFRQEERLRQEFAAINNKHFLAGMKNIKLDSLLLRPAIDLVYIVALMVVLSFFGINAMESPIEIGVLYAFISYLDRFFEPVNNMMMRLSLYQQAIVAGARVFQVLDDTELAPGQIQESDHTITTGKIEFRDVSFSYDGKDDVLKNISFSVEPGETVALVGHTGSGKSSIINLLMRFYEFERGEILIDGRSIKAYSKEELREKIGLVLQDPFLFYGTVKDNIRLHNRNLSDEAIIEAAKFVRADSFIEKLEHGYDERTFERGANFSSGERQLIAFARTIAANPKVLILDEATASIDTETEEAIGQALEKMQWGRTTIAVAHRLSTIQDANQILVLHKGEIVERGSHQELLAHKGLYYHLYLLQNGLVEKTSETRMSEGELVGKKSPPSVSEGDLVQKRTETSADEDGLVAE